MVKRSALYLFPAEMMVGGSLAGWIALTKPASGVGVVKNDSDPIGLFGPLPGKIQFTGGSHIIQPSNRHGMRRLLDQIRLSLSFLLDGFHDLNKAIEIFFGFCFCRFD
jgi:hypothetical protein